MGKSLVTSLLATKFSRKGYKTAVLDADITGPSIPKMFGVTGRAESSDLGIFPRKTHGDISSMTFLCRRQEVKSIIKNVPVSSLPFLFLKSAAYRFSISSYGMSSAFFTQRFSAFIFIPTG